MAFSVLVVGPGDSSLRRFVAAEARRRMWTLGVADPQCGAWASPARGPRARWSAVIDVDGSIDRDAVDVLRARRWVRLYEEERPEAALLPVEKLREAAEFACYRARSGWWLPRRSGGATEERYYIPSRKDVKDVAPVPGSSVW